MSSERLSANHSSSWADTVRHTHRQTCQPTYVACFPERLYWLKTERYRTAKQDDVKCK